MCRECSYALGFGGKFAGPVSPNFSVPERGQIQKIPPVIERYPRASNPLLKHKQKLISDNLSIFPYFWALAYFPAPSPKFMEVSVFWGHPLVDK